MITTIIIVATLAASAAYSIAWLVKPEFRRSIESPKYDFQARLERYDREQRTPSRRIGVESNDRR